MIRRNLNEQIYGYGLQLRDADAGRKKKAKWTWGDGVPSPRSKIRKSDIMESDEYRIAATIDDSGKLFMTYRSVPLEWAYRSDKYW